MHSLGVPPSAYSTGARHRQGGITKTGTTHARRALREGAWASRSPAQVRRQLPLRLDKVPKPIQALSWKAQVRLGKR
jgi:transposase